MEGNQNFSHAPRTRTKSQNTNPKTQIPNSKTQIPNSKLQIPSSKSQIPKSKFQEPSSKNQEPRTKNQVPSLPALPVLFQTNPRRFQVRNKASGRWKVLPPIKQHARRLPFGRQGRRVNIHSINQLA